MAQAGFQANDGLVFEAAPMLLDGCGKPGMEPYMDLVLRPQLQSITVNPESPNIPMSLADRRRRLRMS